LAKHVVAAAVDLPPGAQMRAEAAGRALAIFNVGGRLYAVRDVCPHKGAPLSSGVVVGTLTAPHPGEYRFDETCAHLRCPWHGWEYDLASGQSWYEADAKHVRTYPVSVEDGRTLVPGPYVAETIPVSIEGDYVVVEIGGDE
jgi:3-phenylpropionate/trans-cinnamate dioxygenase ferredoxin subunit